MKNALPSLNHPGHSESHRITRKNGSFKKMQVYAVLALLAFVFGGHQPIFASKAPDPLRLMAHNEDPVEHANTSSVLAEINGTVTGSTGEPLIGVNIQVKGTTKGSTTDFDGRYSIEAGMADTLMFSYIGYKMQMVPVDNRTTIDVMMMEDASRLDEVIVVAYGTSTKGSYTGAASVIDQKEIEDVPSTTFQNALAGKAPGVQVASSSGQAGATTSIRIRGIGSMNASNEPLYVIDGVPVSSGNAGQLSDYVYASNNVMNSINPSDIASITILKDAAASSLYGSRAANGVVLITTKKGKLGKPKITLRSSVGFTPSWATDNYEPAGTQQNVNMLYRVFHDYNTGRDKSLEQANSDALRRLNVKFNKHGYYFETDGLGVAENVNIRGMTDGMVNREGTYFDWEDALFRTGTFNTNDISVSGGDENTRYYSSLSYTKDQNRIKVNGYDRITGRVNLSQKIGKRIDFISNINISSSKLSGYNDTRNLSSNYYLQTRNLLWGLYWPTDYKTGEPWTARYGSYGRNNVYYDNEWDNSGRTLRISPHETVIINILPELNLKSVFSYDNTRTKDHIYYSANHFNGSNSNGTVSELSTTSTKLVSSTTLNYDKFFGNHRIGLLGGFEAEKNNTDFQRSTGNDLPSSALPTVATAGELDASAYSWGNAIQSFLSRAEYNYDEKYYASASFRRDGSSRLGPETRWGNFYSVAGSWRLDREDFMQNASVISALRLRASYGVNGTLPSTNFGWRSLTGYGNSYVEQAGGGISTIADANLTWETNYTTDVALEYGLFEQRLYGTIEYFSRDSRDLLQSVPISRVTGFSSTLKNVGEINNRGVELSLGGDILNTSEVRWSANINASFISSKVTKLYRGEGEETGADIIWYDPTGSDSRAQFIYREGEPTLAFYGYEWAGVDPENGKNTWYVNDPNDPSAGEFLFNGRGASYNFRDANRIITGNGTPKVFGGLNSDVEYKGIALGLNFIYKIGGDLYDGASKDVIDDGYYWERIRAQYEYDNMWTVENPNGSLPKLSGFDPTDAIQFSSRNLYDASFLRLKNVTLSYNLPTAFVNRAGISNTRIYFNGSNLLTFSKYPLADPEVNQYSTRGWETPYGKTYTFGVELSF
ncbi:TonB-dependent receptor [Membranicola marinus]|uniref:TonB-dependent receptor n=1 Tax=Membranihabitans marinus TaxID=1227546 RepID=A0A953HQJ4_9BACT|nr:TonB-dependent receptor [Membranihabitans marinus]MBY5959419.1 TonB-dependent receptor [Membranihabitans marinus]